MNSMCRILFIGLLLLLGGCIPAYSLVTAGPVSVSGLQVNPGQAWNLAPAIMGPANRKETQVWTQDGLLLDRLIIIPGVPDGEGIVTSVQKDAAVPLFRAGMLPNEIEELAESSIVKQFGEGGVAVETSSLRPHRFGEHRGILFNMDVTVSDGPDYSGLAGSFIVDDRLYMMMFFGAQPYYYEKHIAEAETIIMGARLLAAEPG